MIEVAAARHPCAAVDAVSNPLGPSSERLAMLALPRLSDDELEAVHLQLFFEREVLPGDLRGSVAYRALSMLGSRLARERREATDPATEVRATRDLIHLRRRVAERYAGLLEREPRDLAWLVDAYTRTVGRGIHPRELEQWLAVMREHPLDRTSATATLRRVAEDERRALEEPADPGSCWVMGTSRTIGPGDWRRRTLELRGHLVRGGAEGGRAAWDVRDAFPASSIVPAAALGGEAPRCLVSVITSLYKGGRFIEAFMANICAQSIFRDWCELIIVDAASPEGEGDVIRRYMSQYPNIRYIRTPDRIGIYEAWNLGVGEARGDLLTNANVDDLRRGDSLEIQAATLQTLTDVDVVYQDVYYGLEACLPFDRIAAYGFRSRMPRITPAVALSFNPPHNAPMWRRRLHEELGLFDTRYRSAGDYEFWLRCAAKGKVFHRVDDPHVAYYQNPRGCSTRADTPGHDETRELTARYAPRLLAMDGSRWE